MVHVLSAFGADNDYSRLRVSNSGDHKADSVEVFAAAVSKCILDGIPRRATVHSSI